MATFVVNEQDFWVLLNTSLKGCRFCTVRYTTDIDSNNKKLMGGRKNEFYGKVTTATECKSAYLGADYENGVNNRLATVGMPQIFESDPLPWGEWYRFPYTITHKGGWYFRFYIGKQTKVNKTYYVDGNVADDQAAVEKAFRTRKPSQRQVDAGVAPQDCVQPCSINIRNVVSLTVNENIYVISH